VKSFQISKLNPLDDGSGTMLSVSPCSFFMDISLKDIPGLEFILQLCVEDDERAGTVLSVSNKYAYNSIFKFPPMLILLLDITLYLPHVLCSNTQKPR
jgi:hypothetical protein